MHHVSCLVGAGTANMFSTAVGHPNCCALVELFPDKKLPFHTIRGFGNLARHYGMHYYRFGFHLFLLWLICLFWGLDFCVFSVTDSHFANFSVMHQV